MKSINYFILSLLFISTATLVSCEGSKADNITSEETPTTEAKLSTEVVSNLTKITFERDLHDFGEIIQNELVTTDFKFTNTGKHPLIITNAKGSCGCTVPEWPKEPIPPGGSGVITVAFDSKNRSALFNKTVTVTANTKPGESRLIIKGNIIVPKN